MFLARPTSADAPPHRSARGRRCAASHRQRLAPSARAHRDSRASPCDRARRPRRRRPRSTSRSSSSTPGDRLAHRGRAERLEVVDREHGARLGQPVADHDREAEVGRRTRASSGSTNAPPAKISRSRRRSASWIGLSSDARQPVARAAHRCQLVDARERVDRPPLPVGQLVELLSIRSRSVRKMRGTSAVCVTP